ncbi:YceI family protein [Aestuariibius sp. 2305UL40-4]|uniref:YceI family protein n=1 Tax=Aestuariibius violaceus TaxID=3234132 RepID=UPI00345EC49E
MATPAGQVTLAGVMLRLCVILWCVFGASAWADPERYALDAGQSTVGFTYDFTGREVQGQMPVADADLLIDLDRVSASRVAVSLDPSKADGGFAFASQALRSAQVLDAARHPRITFQSTSITGDLSGARVTGNLTVRGVTRPVTLNAALYRQQGTAAGERDRLSIILTGAVDRTAFGASGYPGYVGPVIDITILARVDRVR